MIYPTFVEIAAATPAAGYQTDGLSLVPLLRDPSAALNREAIFWHFPCYLPGSGDPRGGPFRTTPAGAVRSGDWKLIEWFETGRLELYNLRDDLSEVNDLSQTNPAKLSELHCLMKAWRAKVSAPIPTTPNPKYDPAAKPGRAKQPRNHLPSR